MFEIKKVDVSIISELERLKIKKMKAPKDGKDPNCKLCDEDGNIKVSRDAHYGVEISRIFEECQSLINIKCECYSDRKKLLGQKIDRLLELQSQFRKVFGLSELNNNQELEALTPSSCAKMFSLDSTMNVIEKWLSNSMPCSLFFTGRPGTGKTTTLKMLWQIMALNNYSCYFFDCLKFEELCFNLFNKDAGNNIKNKIYKMVELASSTDLLLMDEHASINLNTALMYYFKIFNSRSEKEKACYVL